VATAILHPDTQRFPVGATVKAYKRSNFPGIWDFTGAPAGSQDASATVASDGSITFTGLTENTDYVLYAATPDRYAQFATRTTRTLPDGSSAATQAAGDNSTKVATTAYVDTASGLLIPKSLVDAKGDLLVGSADDTVIRKAVGTDGQVLTADAASAGGLQWATPMPTLAVATGQYIGGIGSPSNVAFVPGNQARGVPFKLERQTTFDRIAINVATLGASSQARVGVYTLVGGVPSALAFDAGSFIDCSTAGVKTVTINQTLAAGHYVAVCGLFTAGCTLKAVVGGGGGAALLRDGSGWADISGWNVGPLDGSGFLTAPSAPALTNNCPLVYLRAA
jgi:hypothetical protein